MPQRPSSPAAGATTWRLDAPAVPGRLAGSRSLRQTLLLANVAGFLGGYFVLHNQWLQLGWGVILAGIWLLAGGHETVFEGLRRDRWLQMAAALLGLGLLRSTLVDSPGATVEALWTGWGNSLLLVGFLLSLWQAARLPLPMNGLGRPVVTMAAIAAGASLLVFYSLHPQGVFGARLKNWLVYGGWNSVNSGLTFAFAACWAAAGWNEAVGRRQRRLWLVALVLLDAAALLSLSRGAWLALLSGHGVLLLAVGWRRAWKPVVLVVALLALFQISAPMISWLAAKDASKRLGIPNETVAVQQLGDEVVSSNPMQTAVERSDNGRFLIYGAALNSMTTWQDWLVGKGMWAADDCWSCSLHWYPEHLHGVFWDTFVHGGLPGLLGLAALVGWGLKRAYWLAQNGEPAWIMLAGGGLAGLLCDGDTVWLLVSVARYEPLLFWTPLVIASARFLQRQEAAENGAAGVA